MGFAILASSAEKGLFLDTASSFGKQIPPISHHTWSSELKANAGSFSGYEISPESVKLRISPEFPWQKMDKIQTLRTRHTYLPPECDFVRIKARALSGSFKVCLGGPTVYFGCSDVFSPEIEIIPDKSGDWKTFDFDLNGNLSRNMRRAGRTSGLPRPQYSRWVQEPLSLYALNGSSGELEVASIEYMSQGVGGAQITSSDESKAPENSETLANFANPSDHQRAFTLTLEEKLRPNGAVPVLVGEIPDGRTKIETEPGKVRVWHPPPKIGFEKDCVVFTKRFAEELVFGGIKINGVNGCNAIALKIKASPRKSPPPGAVLDILLISSPSCSAFDWKAFSVSVDWAKKPPFNFDAFMGWGEAGKNDFSLYHARALLPPDEWRWLIVPLNDFLCCYGEGAEGSANFAKMLPPKSSEIVGIAFLAPFRHCGDETRISVKEVRLAQIPAALDKASYKQLRP